MITIIAPISRDKFLTAFLQSLNDQDLPAVEAKVIFYIDGHQRLYELLKRILLSIKFKYPHTVYFRGKGIPSVSGVMRRRKKIAEVHNEIRSLVIESDYVFLTEDDTLLPSNAISKLHQDIVELESAGLVSGVQVGRWGYEMIGGWVFDSIKNPTNVVSVPLGEGTKEIDAAGLYCTLTKSDYYIHHTFSPFEDALGPDATFGLALRRRGLRNYIDYDLRCLHMTDKGDIGFAKVVQVEKTKQPDGRWSQGLLNP